MCRPLQDRQTPRPLQEKTFPGKVLANRSVPELESGTEPDLGHHDHSTANLIRRYRAARRH